MATKLNPLQLQISLYIHHLPANNHTVLQTSLSFKLDGTVHEGLNTSCIQNSLDTVIGSLFNQFSVTSLHNSEWIAGYMPAFLHAHLPA